MLIFNKITVLKWNANYIQYSFLSMQLYRTGQDMDIFSRFSIFLSKYLCLKPSNFGSGNIPILMYMLSVWLFIFYEK